MPEIWQTTGRFAQAAIVGTCLIPMIALALHWSLRRARADQRYYVWIGACIVMLSAILLAPLTPWRAEFPASRAFARAAYSAGVPVTELVELQSGETGVVQRKRLTRRSVPQGPFRAFLAVWLLGFIVVAARKASSYRAAVRLVAGSSPAPPVLVESLTARMPPSLRNVRTGVHIAPACTPAFTWGVLRPRILLPSSLLQRPADAALVLAHELHHVRNRDFAVQVCADVLTCIAWWNPIVWLVRRQVGTEREYAADAGVLTAGADPAAYVESLLAAASWLSSPAPAAADVSRLARRVQRISVWTQAPRRTVHATPAYALAIVLTACVVVAMWSGVQGSIGVRGVESVDATLVQVTRRELAVRRLVSGAQVISMNAGAGKQNQPPRPQQSSSADPSAQEERSEHPRCTP